MFLGCVIGENSMRIEENPSSRLGNWFQALYWTIVKDKKINRPRNVEYNLCIYFSLTTGKMFYKSSIK